MPTIIDLHSHTYPASHDGKSTMQQMVHCALQKNVAYYGITNHVDYDVNPNFMTVDQRLRYQNGNESQCFCEARTLQNKHKGQITVLAGAEFGFAQDPLVLQRYVQFCHKHQPDYVINSIHSLGGVDYCRLQLSNDAQQIFSTYLQLVRRSLDAPYHYDIVGHLEYVVRYVPFEPKHINLAHFQQQIDDILQTIIAKDKILEVNTSVYTLPRLCLPNQDILRRYHQLGGRKICFGSDAHSVERIADKFQQVVQLLADIGFTHFTIPLFGKHVCIPF